MSGAGTGSPRTRWLAIAAILCACLGAYLPALDAGWIWDDDSYVLENPAVRTEDGFVDAWIPGRTPQWYPMVFVSLWAQHAVHGILQLAVALRETRQHGGSVAINVIEGHQGHQ